MKECEVPENTVLGKVCRLNPGSGKESCYLLSEVEGETGKNVGYLEPLVKRALGCPFQKDVLERIKEKKLQSNRSGLE